MSEAKPSAWRGPLPPVPYALFALFAVLPIGIVLANVGFALLDAARIEEGRDIAQRFVGLLAMQAALVLVAWGFARRGFASVEEGLSWQAPRLSWPTTLALVGAVPLCMLAGSLLVFLLPFEPGENVRAVHEELAGLRGTAALASVAVAVIAPAVGEELFFRGLFLRLTRQAGRPLWAILWCAVAFAAYHMDPLQSLAVLPLSLWLTWLVWRSGSVWPAMLGHALHNALVLLVLREVGGLPAEGEEFSAPPTVMPLAWASALLCLPYGLRRLRGEAYVADDFSRAD